MEVYIILTAAVVLISFLDHIEISELYNKLVAGILNFVLIILAGFRFETGHDYYNYINIFKKMGSIEQYVKTDGPNQVEWCYALINYVVKKLGLGPSSLFFIISLMTILIFSYAIRKYTSYYYTSMAMFYFLLFYENSMGHIRAGMAMGIILCSVQYIEEQRFLRFFVLVMLAAAFHSTAFVVLPIYFVRKLNLSKIVMAGSLATAFILGNINVIDRLVGLLSSLSFKALIITKIMNYSSNEAISSIIKTALMRISILVLFVMLEPKISHRLKCCKTLMYMYFSGVFLLLLLANSPNDFTTRGTRALIFVQILILPAFLHYIKNIYLRLISHNFIILYGAALFWSYMNSFEKAFVPYRNIFMK